jgi:adenylylsulfate kinase-like enzyme
MEPTVFHLTGFPGVGELTVAQALAEKIEVNDAGGRE